MKAHKSTKGGGEELRELLKDAEFTSLYIPFINAWGISAAAVLGVLISFSRFNKGAAEFGVRGSDLVCKTGLSRPTVTASIRKLVAEGAISYKSGIGKDSNLYTLKTGLLKRVISGAKRCKEKE